LRHVSIACSAKPRGSAGGGPNITADALLIAANDADADRTSAAAARFMTISHNSAG
jgi:hypothetical protein